MLFATVNYSQKQASVKMDGQCFACTEKFGIFRKEHGCKNCGYAFCSKCLGHSIVLPNRGPKEQNVCNKCYKKLTASPGEGTDSAKTQDIEPPENYKKMVEELAAKKDNPSPNSSSLSSKKKGPGKKEDREITERLGRLKAARDKMRGRTLSTEEIEVRLEKLKGHQVPSASSDSKAVPPHQPPDQRTQQEQTQDLMKQMKEEAAIDAKMDGIEGPEESASVPAGSKEEDLETEMGKLMQEAKDELKKEEKGLERDAEIALRLAKVNTGNKAPDGGKEPDGGEKMEVDEEEDEEEASKRLIQQLLEQDRLETKTSGYGFSAQGSQPQPGTSSVQQPSGGEVAHDPDELPWCCICNEDATLRCHGCDNDLYCHRCFREGHDGFDLKNHRMSTYRPPRPIQS